MPTCCAFGCNNRTTGKSLKQREKEIEKRITFHKFPKNPERRAAWIKAIRRVGWEPNSTSSVCSEHFTEESFDRTSLSYVRLRESATPTIFPSYPTYLQKKNKPARRKIVRALGATVTGITPILPTSIADSDLSQETFTSYELPKLHMPSTSTSCIAHGSMSNIPLGGQEESRRKFSRSTSISPLNRIHHELSPAKTCLLKKIHDMKLKYRKKIALLQQNKRRNIKKIATLKNVLKSLKDKNLLQEEQLRVLNNIGSPTAEILKRHVARNTHTKVNRTYSPELRKFAVTLHYYSPNAYRYVRNTFNSCLPHPKTISKWYSSINGQPGFTPEAFTAIKFKCEYSDRQLVASLCIDEMTVRRKIEFDGKHKYGYVNFGIDNDDDFTSEAKDALVFLVVCINDSWKIPVAYFLVDGVNADQRCNLVNICLRKCHEVGLRIISLTFDGAASNMSMMTKLGFNIEKQISWFCHPNTEDKVYLYPDPCHMLKNVRNAFGDKKIFYDYCGRIINWQYIVFLQELQQKEGLNLANKIKKNHINFRRQIMKVRLAAQLLSSSTATALEFCCNELKLPEFENSEGTTEFIRIFNNLFDIFNSKNVWQLGYKKALCENNSVTVLETLNICENYIKNLKCENGTTLIMSQRKVGFIGFLSCIWSLRSMYENLIVQSSVLQYIPTYKLNQDHLEMLFSTIRAKGGFNNNPTARQFCSAYKKILVHSQLKSNSRGNCIPLEEISFLHVSSSLKRTNAINILNRSTSKFRILDEDDDHLQLDDDTNYHCEIRPQDLSNFSTHVVAYISGFIVRQLKKKIFCEECLSVLEQYPDESKNKLKFIISKDNGGLIYPSDDVIHVCTTTEKVIKQALFESGGHQLKKKFNTLYLVTSVLKYYSKKYIFVQLSNHILNQNPFENHMINLIRAISEKYVLIRLHYITNNYQNKLETRRQEFTKLIQFQGW